LKDKIKDIDVASEDKDEIINMMINYFATVGITETAVNGVNGLTHTNTSA